LDGIPTYRWFQPVEVRVETYLSLKEEVGSPVESSKFPQVAEYMRRGGLVATPEDGALKAMIAEPCA
jgi:hypothetical protein